MGVSKDGRKKKKKVEGATPTRSVEKSEGVLWSKRTVSKRNSDKYGRVNDAVGGGIIKDYLLVCDWRSSSSRAQKTE